MHDLFHLSFLHFYLFFEISLFAATCCRLASSMSGGRVIMSVKNAQGFGLAHHHPTHSSHFLNVIR